MYLSYKQNEDDIGQPGHHVRTYVRRRTHACTRTLSKSKSVRLPPRLRWRSHSRSAPTVRSRTRLSLEARCFPNLTSLFLAPCSRAFGPPPPSLPAANTATKSGGAGLSARVGGTHQHHGRQKSLATFCHFTRSTLLSCLTAVRPSFGRAEFRPAMHPTLLRIQNFKRRTYK